MQGNSTSLQQFFSFWGWTIALLLAVVFTFREWTPQSSNALNWRFRLIMAAVIVVGLVLSVSDTVSETLNWQTPSAALEVMKRLGDALIIAGVLGLAVDRYMKRTLVYEITRDVLSFAAGHELPPDLKDHVNLMIGYPFIRSNFTISLAMEQLRNNQNFVRLTMITSYDVKGLLRKPLDYPVKTAIEKSRWSKLEPSRLIKVEVTGASGDTIYEPALLDGQRSTRTHFEFEKVYRLERVGGTPLTVKTTRSTVYPDEWFYLLDILETTLGGITVITEQSDEFEWDVDFVRRGVPQRIGNRWHYPDVYLPGQFIRITWVKRGQRDDHGPKLADSSVVDRSESQPISIG